MSSSGGEAYMELLRPSWSETILASFVGTFKWSYFELGPVVKEEMLFKEKVYALRTKTSHKS